MSVPRRTLLRIAAAALAILLISALAKSLVFNAVLEPDETGRQRVTPGGDSDTSSSGR